ncbi:hypothetical protein FDP41_003672 [Naegleria fowleri]|uniref:F-box domain-containing protein n=1 Tax=Naegleria fowleri TaxID=5763 RepID=A0A6A5BRA1_NAEFO|nr:uncharacterized protein FDP41_004646 [Naegleria fowleri]XP_044561732.1 uncharacterized protein FDP41_003672 [Naegleria fowleri]KAF0976340.1 hypothetical protein FDP41_004646 [Naegleria fowleri]KAF0977019.1 hypothetical protein FDP41_003672 [Naegleria fowleri]
MSCSSLLTPSCSPIIGQTFSSLSLVPYEIIYQILQFVECPKELERFRRVHSSWNLILHGQEENRKEDQREGFNDNVDATLRTTLTTMFWREKLQQSSLLKFVSNTSRISSNLNISMAMSSIPSSVILHKRNQLVMQWENDDCIKYWTSNYLQVPTTTSTITTTTSSPNVTISQLANSQSENKVFQSSLKMNECGILFIESSRHLRSEQQQDLTSSMTFHPFIDFCKSTYQDMILLKQLQQELLSVHQTSREYHKMTWKDPSTPSAVNSPLIPLILPPLNHHHHDQPFGTESIISIHNQQQLISLEFICHYLGVHEELYKLPERTLHKRILLKNNLNGENNPLTSTPSSSYSCLITTPPATPTTTTSNESPQPLSSNLAAPHPLVERTSSTIEFQQIFPSDQFNAEFCQELSQWMHHYMEHPTLIMLGVSQLNPIPVLIVGESTREFSEKWKETNSSCPRNIIGFMTSTFRVPEFAE